ncbi:MAG: ParB/RepB/Spo0J family partition protein [Coxiellaceae bacterium]|jgi:ParB family chromosome partitioning protein|nr:ParB/RepB/Spo0J family partition protein [Coxiellaceae bacterium]
MSKKSSLGIGLGELLSNIKTINIESKTALKQSPIDLLKPGKYQPRQDMSKEALTELADSIRTQGIIQPLIVRPISDGNYEIIAGERRWRAAQLANLHEVPVVIREIPDKQAIAISLIENIQREDLNAIDTAIGIERLIKEFSMTHENAASAIGKSRTMVTNLLRLLSLPEEIKIMVQHSLLEMGHARALLTLDLTKQLTAAKIIIAKKLSVRASELLVKQLQKPGITIKKDLDNNIKHLQKQLADTFAAQVNIHHTKKGRGKIIIKYNNLDELDGILKHIR